MRSRSIFSGGRRRGDEQLNISIAVVFAALYWVAQALAFLFPGVAAFNPEFAAAAPTLLGLPGQLGLGIIIFALLGGAYLLERKRITGHVGGVRDATAAAPSPQQPHPKLS